MNKHIVFFSILFFLSFCELIFADVSMKTDGLTAIKITGVIRDGDEEQFRKYVSEYGTPYFIDLDSKGGSVDAAISIGMQIRQLGVPPFIQIWPQSKCISSCVLILAGGLSRLVLGSVGIHRPFLPLDENLTVENQKKAYKDIEKKIKDYLNEVNIPITLYDTMFRIPAADMVYLNERELQYFNLNEDDPYYEEAENAKRAKENSMTKFEYLKFLKDRNETCIKYLNFSDPDMNKKLTECEINVKKKYTGE